MSQHAVRAAAVAAACLTASVALVPSAHADTRTSTDKGAHLTTVAVAHTRTRVTVRADVGPLEIGDHTTFWLRVGSFASRGTAVDCDGFRATSDVFGPEEVTTTVPRRCIGRPAEVRVAVRAFYEEDGPDVVDWGPGTKKFFGWVAR